MTRLYSPSALGPRRAGRGEFPIVLIGISIEANVIAGNGSVDLGASP
jgi:hypothetical protein